MFCAQSESLSKGVGWGEGKVVREVIKIILIRIFLAKILQPETSLSLEQNLREVGK